MQRGLTARGCLWACLMAVDWPRLGARIRGPKWRGQVIAAFGPVAVHWVAVHWAAVHWAAVRDKTPPDLGAVQFPAGSAAGTTASSPAGGVAAPVWVSDAGAVSGAVSSVRVFSDQLPVAISPVL